MHFGVRHPRCELGIRPCVPLTYHASRSMALHDLFVIYVHEPFMYAVWWPVHMAYDLYSVHRMTLVCSCVVASSGGVLGRQALEVRVCMTFFHRDSRTIEKRRNGDRPP